MKKILAVLFLFLFSVSTATADTLLSQTVENGDFEISTTTVTRPTQTIDCNKLSGEIETVTLKVSSNNTATQTLAIIARDTDGVFSTSSIMNAITYIGGYREQTATFTPAVVCDTGTLQLHVVKTAGNNIAYGRHSSSNTYLDGVCHTTNDNCADWYVKINGIIITPTPDGGGTCDMSSTTDAVYAVGYSINLYMGIFIAILFGILSYIFVRKFIT